MLRRCRDLRIASAPSQIEHGTYTTVIGIGVECPEGRNIHGTFGRMFPAEQASHGLGEPKERGYCGLIANGF